MPSAIRVNMLRLRLRTEAQPRLKNGSPHQTVTGEASANSAQTDTVDGTIRSHASPGICPAIASTTSGTVKTAPIQNRRRMSISSGLGWSAALTVIGSSAMPQTGQSPGPSWTISGCIGQV